MARATIIDLHNHTKLCQHAKGEMEEYVQRAIEKKIDIFGFSDHAPMDFDKKYRMSKDEASMYLKKIEDIKKRYKNKIEILSGFEVDFLPPFIEKEILNAKLDYLIGAIHFLPKKPYSSELWGFDNPEFIGHYKNVNIDTLWEEYFFAIEKMAKSGFFQIVAHFDLIKVFGFKPKKEIRLIVKNALKSIKKSNMTLEISSAGIRKPAKEPYPSKDILKMAYEMDIPITFGSDSHKPEDVGYRIKELIAVAKEIGYSKCAIYKNKDREFIDI